MMAWKDVGLTDGLNQSKIKMYQRCPRQFYFAYVKGLRQPPNLKLTVGTAVHKGTEVNYAQKLKSKIDCEKDVVLDATRDEFREAVKRDGIKESKVNLGKSQDEAIILASAYHDESAPTLQPVIKPETYFEVRIPGAKRMLYGTIDLLAKYFRRAQALVLADIKTTRRSFDLKRADVDIQLTAYAYAAIKLLKLVPKLVMFDTVVLNGSKARAEHVISTRSAAELQRFEETFKEVEKGIDAGVFPPTDNEQTCGWCGFNSICFKGRVWTK